MIFHKKKKNELKITDRKYYNYTRKNSSFVLLGKLISIYEYKIFTEIVISYF